MTNELLLILLAVAVVLLGVASEFLSAPVDRLLRVAAAVLGVVVLVAVLVR